MVFAIYLFSALIRAESQDLERFASDRPQIFEVITRGDSMWKLLDAKFKNINGLPAIWSAAPSKDPSHYLSAHTYNEHGQAILKVANIAPDGTRLPGEQVLALLIFEMYNAGHRNEFYGLGTSASKGIITKQKYEEGMAKVEFESVMELQKFQVDVWIPYAVEKHISWQNGDYWMKGACQDFDKWYWEQHLMGNGYPDDVYGSYFDYLVSHRVNEAK